MKSIAFFFVAGKMNIHPSDRVGVFIDGAHLNSASRALGFDVDFKRFLDLFRRKGRLVRAIYFIGVNENRSDCTLRPLLDWLAYNGYSIVTRREDEFGQAAGRHCGSVALDVELAVNAMQIAETLDHIVLVTGKGAFRGLVSALQLSGKRVSVLSTLETKPPMIADELRRQADQFIDLVDVETEIRRDDRN